MICPKCKKEKGCQCGWNGQQICPSCQDEKNEANKVKQILQNQNINANNPANFIS